MRRRNRVPGCIFINHGWHWWRVRLPGEKELKARPLIPDGGTFATDDPGVAEEIARDMYARAVFAAGATETLRRPRREKRPAILTMAVLVREYLVYARTYYKNPAGLPARPTASRLPCGCSSGNAHRCRPSTSGRWPSRNTGSRRLRPTSAAVTSTSV